MAEAADDADYDSDSYQVKQSRHILLESLDTSINHFVKKDPLTLIENLQRPIGSSNENAMMSRPNSSLELAMRVTESQTTMNDSMEDGNDRVVAKGVTFDLSEEYR